MFFFSNSLLKITKQYLCTGLHVLRGGVPAAVVAVLRGGDGMVLSLHHLHHVLHPPHPLQVVCPHLLSSGRGPRALHTLRHFRLVST